LCAEREGGYNGVCLAVDYRYVNKFTLDDAYPLPNLQSIYEDISRNKWISVLDCKAGNWQLLVEEQDQWMTAFVCDMGLFEFS